MSATDLTFDPVTGGGVDGAIISGDNFRHESLEKWRQSIAMSMYNSGHYDLGGSDDTGVLSASYVPVMGCREFSLNGDSLDGLDLDAVLFSRTFNASTTVTLRVRNVTDSTTAGTSTVNASTNTVKEVVALTLASGVKVYRLEVIGSDALNDVVAWGYLRFRAVPE